MRTDELDFDLPAELVAQEPAPARQQSLLMHVRAGSGVEEVAPFGELFPRLLRDDDLVVVNDTRVINARIQARRPTGGRVELLLLQPLAGHDRRWQAMVRPARRLAPGMQLAIEGDGRPLLAVERTGSGTWTMELPEPTGEVPGWLEEVGEQPLPPYITSRAAPADRYQTVYAERPGSVAAPTAGLHLDEDLHRQLVDEGRLATVTLHVGAGTFLPVRSERLDDHRMHEEWYEVTPGTDELIVAARAAGRRIVAIGTTSVRVLETVYARPGVPRQGRTDIFIRPGHRFACVDALLTNFHLPRSTLIALVMAAAGIDVTRAAYAEAIERRMRFFSFGDAMFIDRP